MQKNWLVTNFNKNYFLKFGNKVFRCQIGSGGLKYSTRKVEGDRATPIGKWHLESLYYRSDRVLRSQFKRKNVIKVNRISKTCGWCDDIRSIHYNKYININNSTSLKINYEKLWREDNAYDIIIVTSYNIKPTIKNKGSAIFIHCSFKDIRPTAGCIALKKRDLIYLAKNLKNNICVEIKN